MATIPPRSLMAEAPWPVFAPDEMQAVQRVLETGKVNYWTGTEGREFEKEFAAACDAKFGIAMMNGSVTIEGILAALGICGPEHEVIVTPRSFMASASSVVLRGARPVWADVDRRSGNLSAQTIAEVVTPQTKAVILVHLAGWPCDMDPILDLAAEKGFAVIEDCAQAHGATYKGKPVGSIGIANSWSFCQDKIMTLGGEGGVVTTDDEELWSRIWSLKDHGKSYEAVYQRQHPPGFRWLHESFGSNWRLTEMQAAIGRAMLPKLPLWTEIRNRNAQVLKAALEPFGCIRLEEPTDGSRHAFYKFYCYVEPDQLKESWTRDRIMTEIAATGVPAFSGSCSEMYRELAFVRAGLGPAEDLPVARELGETSLMFLVHPTLTVEHMEYAAERIQVVLRQAQR